jgi:hypothetical protein
MGEHFVSSAQVTDLPQAHFAATACAEGERLVGEDRVDRRPRGFYPQSVKNRVVTVVKYPQAGGSY